MLVGGCHARGPRRPVPGPSWSPVRPAVIGVPVNARQRTSSRPLQLVVCPSMRPMFSSPATPCTAPVQGLCTPMARLGIVGNATAGGSQESATVQGALPRPAQRGPAMFNLDSEAPELEQCAESSSQSPTYYSMKHPGFDGSTFFIDQEGMVIKEVDAWLDQCYESIKDPDENVNPRPAFINGLPKVGKTCVLNDILPARLRVHPRFGVGKPQEVLLFKLNMESLPRYMDYAAALHSFVFRLKYWLMHLEVPVDERVLEKVVRACRDGSTAEELERAIMLLLQEVKVPCVMLLDDVEFFYMRVTVDGPDVSAAAAAQAFFRTMVTQSPRTMLWAVSGSSTATLWDLFSFIHLPPTHGTTAMQRCWRALVEAYPKLKDTPELYQVAQDTNPAMMITLVQDSFWQQRGADIRSYVNFHHYLTLLEEAFSDWYYALQFLDKAQRVHVCNLATVTVGVDMGLLDRGLAAMLTPFTRPVKPGSTRRCLDSAVQCELILSVITPDGELKKLWRGWSSVGNLEELQAQRLLLQLGNEAVAAQNDNWGDAWQQLKADLQMLGVALAHRGVSLSEWPNQLWFQQVHQSEHNSQGAAAAWDKKWEQHEKGEHTLELWEAVAQFSIMVRNCLGHEEFGNEVIPDLKNGLPRVFDREDATIVTSWPFAESVGHIPAVVGPIAGNLLAVQGSSSGGS